MASMFLAVSMNVSPLERLETLAEKSWVSAESRLAARLKLVRVRVEFSKKRLKTILPWRAGTFLRLRVEISANDSAVSRIATISSADRSSSPSKCFRVQAAAWAGRRGRAPRRPCAGLGGDSCTHGAGLLSDWGGRRAATTRTISSTGIDRLQPDLNAIAAIGRHVQAHDVGLDRQLAVAAVDQSGQADPRGPAQVADRIQRRADGPAGEQDVIDQHDLGAVDPNGISVPRRTGQRPALFQIVAVERDVDGADGHFVVGVAAAAPGPAAGRAERPASGRRPSRNGDGGAAAVRRSLPPCPRSGPRSPGRRRVCCFVAAHENPFAPGLLVVVGRQGM